MGKKNKKERMEEELLKEQTASENEENLNEENLNNEEATTEEATVSEETGSVTSETEASESSAENETDDGVDKKDKNKDPKDEKIKELEDRNLRQLAEFDNFRKRSEKEKSQMYDMGASAIIEKMLPIVDNFERGIASIPEEQADTPLAQGMQMIYKQIMTELENLQVKPIEAVGKEFDANLHNAVMQTESDEYESGIIAAELQKGYTYKDRVIRHSMVSVVS